MTILASLLAIFALAGLAPWLARALGRFAGWALAIAPLAFVGMLLAYAPRIAGGEAIRESLTWAPSLGLSISVSLDGLSFLFALLIAGIGALILIYAQGYLKGHRHLPRMYAYLLMFMGSMLGVVLADNLLVMFVFWELTSVSSYLLIGFDHDRPSARHAALQALLVTGAGGLAMLIGVLLLGSAGQSFETSSLLDKADTIRGHTLHGAMVLLIALGAFTKSAQFPFHFWLPAAMEAPTPVSAYLHSSTMVKAGIYLLARLSPVLGGGPFWTTLLTVVGAVTMVVGAVLAFRQTYLKRLLAYSTVSSLGIIVMALGIGTAAAVEAAMAYLFAHAMFKGALFMVAGNIDHGTGERDVERLGGLGGAMPVLMSVGMLAALSMAGLPPFFGFVGKELLLKAFLEAPAWSMLLVAAFVVTALLTVVVAVLTGVKPFIGSRLPTPHEPHAPGAALLFGPAVLAILGLLAAMFPAYLAHPVVAPAASSVMNHRLEPDLSLWHGWTKELGLSALAVFAGIVLFYLRASGRLIVEVLRPLDRVGPAEIYESGLRGLNLLARVQTAIIQNGYLRSYLFITIGAASLLVGYTVWSRGQLSVLPSSFDVRWYEVAIGVIIALAAIAVPVVRSRLTSIAALGLAGYGVSIMFVIFGAPDLAMTQIAIETLTVVLFAIIFYRLPDFRSITSTGQKVRDLLISVVAGALVTTLVLVASRSPVSDGISTWFGEHSLTSGHGRNVVNVILVDFRAMDTMGEITVLAIAAIGVFALLSPRRKRKGGES